MQNQLPNPRYAGWGGSHGLPVSTGRVRRRHRPDLILLDLDLPNKDGGELLTEIAEDPDVRRIPVIILSSSASEEDISNAYAHCANAYLIKPVDPIEFVSLARTVEEFWFSLAELPSTH
nr:response regulator [Haloprofundus salilacus]